MSVTIPPSFQPLLYDLLGQLDAIFTPPRPQRYGRREDATPRQLAHRRVAREMQRDYHERGIAWNAGGSSASRKRAERELLGAAVRGLVVVHRSGGRVTHVRPGEGIEDQLRAGIALPTLHQAWPLLVKLADLREQHPEREMHGLVWHHEHFDLGVRYDRKGAQNRFEETVLSLLTAGYVVANSDAHGLASFAITDAGLDAAKGKRAAKIEAPSVPDELNDHYMKAWREQLNRIGRSEPADTHDLGPLPLPSGKWYAEPTELSA